MILDDCIKQAAQLVKSGQRIAVLTGAGVSRESGVPTFRDALAGLWAQYDPQTLATLEAFRRNPKLVWDWYEYRRALVRKARPNPGHTALAVLEKRVPHLRIITQNVDDLHEQAGSADVIHLHGNIARSRCFFDCRGYPTVIDVTVFEWDRENGPPGCPHCGRWVRPDVVWFGETLPPEQLETAMQLCAACDVGIVIGTSGLVSPAAHLPALAKRSGAALIEINPDDTMITALADVRLQGPSGEMLPRMLEALDHV